MSQLQRIKEEITKVFPKKQADVLHQVVDVVNETVKVSDFNELKAIVKDLAEAQQDLAQAQKRTEQRLEELAQAQKRTEEEVRKLAIGLNRTREDLGGLSRSFSYAFENEAYRNLPNVLKSKYNIEVKDRIVRADIGGKEINFFAKAQKDGKDIYIIGEAKIRLDKTLKRSDVLKELEEKIKAVKKEYGDVEVLKLLVTHFATKSFLKTAQSEGIIVIQSYEW